MTSAEHRPSGLPAAPVLSAATRAVLAEAARRDRALCAETGAPLAELRADYEHMTDDERGELMLDGFRWRHHWRPEHVALRAERHAAAERRLAIASSHDIAAHRGGWVGPTGPEMRRRRYPPHGDITAWITHGPPDTAPENRRIPSTNRSRRRAA